ncbi:hypothetical protein CcaverHIS641_0702760 [Cutaneotrichosporon cavernicola]|nr:hypothetical protein CcaverHIS641_0702760 [Cutaneotrichosporon cavernicola]
MLLLALTYLTLGVSAATMSWTNATLGNKWTAAQLNDSSFAKEEMLVLFGTHHHIALGNGCLTAPSDPSNGFLVTIEDCDPDSEGQIWSWARHGSEWSFTHGDFCLDVMDGVYDVGTPLQVWECEEHGGNENQVFGFEKMLRIDYGDAEVYVDGITLSW